MKWLSRHFWTLACVVALAACTQAVPEASDTEREPAVQAQLLEVPNLTGRVNDYANVFTPEQETALEASLERIESYEGHPQVVILTVSDIGYETIEDYSLRVARDWGIGQAETNNGLLITAYTDPEDFRVRFETGYGLEGALPDATLYAIYEQRMRPHFKTAGEEDYMTAFTDGITAIDTIIRGEQTGDVAIDNAEAIAAEEAAAARENAKLMSILIVGSLIAGILGFFHISLSGVAGAGTGAFLVHAMGWTLGAYLLWIPLGILGGFIAHGFFLAKISGGGGGSYIGGGSGSLGGGSFGGGGGGFGGGGFSGGR